MSSWRGGNGRNPDRIRPGLRNHFVYRLYNAVGECLYVGCTRLPEARWRQHTQENSQMAAEATRCRMAGPYDYATARAVERAQQYDLHPRWGAIPLTRMREEAPWFKYSAPTHVGGDA